MKSKFVGLLLLATLGHATLPAAVLPNDAVVGDKTLGEWSADWWTWLYSNPVDQNPALDLDGRWATNNQPDGNVFFLAGVFGFSDTAIRTITIPEGKYLFFPLLNTVAGVDPADPPDIETRRLNSKALIDAVVELETSIDGMAVPDLFSHRVVSPVFSFEINFTNNLATFFNGFTVVGLFDNLVADGFYLMVEPLPPGEHVIHFYGLTDNGFSLEVTYRITVQARSPLLLLEELMAKVEAANLPSKRIRPLLAILSRARDSFDKGKLKSGAHHLRTFQHMLQAKVAKLDEATATEWIQAAQEIIDRANSGSKKVRSKKKSLP